jgi:hypothetical protein
MTRRVDIPLRARDGSVRAYAIVDAADFQWLNQWTWRLDRYAFRSERIRGRHRTILMHRLILGLGWGDPREGEHEDRNRLNNQRSNLRIAERAGLDNQQNRGPNANSTSGFRGVSWHRRGRKWRAKVKLAGTDHYLGRFDTPEEADAACKAFRAEHMPFSSDAKRSQAVR